MKFATKLMFVILGLIGIFAMFISYVVYTSNVETLEKEITGRLEDTAFDIMDKIDRMQFERLADIRVMASDPVVSSRDSTPIQIRDRLVEFRNYHKTYISLSFFNLNRVRIADTSGIHMGKQHPLEGYWKEVLTDKGFVMSLTESVSLRRTVFHFAHPVKDKNGETFGVVVAQMPVSKLHYITEEELEIYKRYEELRIDLIDKDGLLLYSNTNKKGILKDNYSDRALVKRAMTKDKARSFLHFNPVSKEKELCVFVRERGYLDFKGNNWTLLVSVPVKVVFAPAVILRNKILFILAFMLVLSTLITLFFSRSITKPISKLAKGAEIIGEGNLKHRVDIKTRDEIAVLAAAFNQMAENRQQAEEKYHNLIEFANVGIIAGKEGKITQVNKKAEEIYGYSREELIGQSPAILVPEKYREKHQEILNEILKSGKAKKMTFEEEGVRKDGSTFPIEISFALTKPEEKAIIAVMRDITERKRAEKELKKTKDHLDNVIESSLDGIVIGDSTGNIISANETFLKMVGYQKEEIKGMHVMELSIIEKGIYKSTTGDEVKIDEEFFNDAKKMTYEKLFKEGKITNWETYYLRKDKKIVPVEMTVSYLYSAEGDIVGSVGINRDITERKEKEDEIREGKEFLENIFKTSTDAILVTDSQGNITMINDSIEKMVGYSRNELLGKHVGLLISPDEQIRSNADKEHEKFLQKGRIYESENVWQRKDGQRIFVESNMSLLKDNDGQIIGAVGFTRDITERKKFEEALKKSEEKYHNLIENANDAVISINKEGIVVTLNKKVEEMYGYAREELLGKSVVLLVPPDHREEQKKAIEKFKTIKPSEMTGKTMETKGFTKDGREFFAEASIFGLETKGGNIFTSFIRDITERKEMEHRLLQSEKLKSLGELAGGVAHDFNNVLAAILGNAQLLKMAIETPPGKEERRKVMDELKKGLNVIVQASRDGAETVRRIQEFARGRIEDKYFAPVHINEVIENALEFTRTKWKDDAESKGIKLDIKKEFSPLPLVSGSASELREVVVNLINNAADAMPKGGQIGFKSYKEGDYVCIRVEDTGAGIADDRKGRIFDPFFTTKGVKSSGLGLSVSYGIINRHQGTITADSVEGKGTTLTIKLPIPERVVKEEKAGEAISGEKKKARILVIEDEEQVRDLLASILIKDGHEVEATTNGEEGIGIFEKKEFDLVFTDLGMPGMSGWQVAEKVKSINGRVPVILVTGWNIGLKESEVSDSWVDLIVKKPFDVNQVQRIVQEGMILRERFKAD